jgi:hypothetical protein
MRGVSKGWAAVLSALVLAAFFLTAGVIESTASFVVEKAEKARLQRLTTDYASKESEHFVIRFSKRDTEVIHRVCDQAESQLALAADYFGYRPEQKILLTVYHDKDNLQKGLRLPSGGTTLGAYYAGTIGVLSPNVWGHEGGAAEKGLYLHELTHLIMADMAGGNYPLWFTEGMALYQEYLNTGFEWGKEYRFEELPYSIEELTGDFSRLDQFLAYKQSFLLVKALVEMEGRDRILKLFGVLDKNAPFNTAFLQVFGYTPEKLWVLAEKSSKKMKHARVGGPLHVKIGD